MKPQHHYQAIDLASSLPLRLNASRAFWAGLGLNGEIISTPGHSEDSVTLILDEGLAFTGDLPRLPAADGGRDLVQQSWEKIRACHAKTIYPGHGPAWLLS
jgi:glyoxylase-like metal-dependent hydrolase (beta-lactamase superfamily II)